ncbi:hypothetical protein [Methylorubrum extorquens]
MSDGIPVVQLGPQDMPQGDHVLIEVADRYGTASEAKIVGGCVLGEAISDELLHADASVETVIEEAKRQIRSRYTVPVTIYVHHEIERM